VLPVAGEAAQLQRLVALATDETAPNNVNRRHGEFAPHFSSASSYSFSARLIASLSRAMRASWICLVSFLSISMCLFASSSNFRYASSGEVCSTR
jgi:hypothetical protein